jgi:hypothetical protein
MYRSPWQSAELRTRRRPRAARFPLTSGTLARAPLTSAPLTSAPLTRAPGWRPAALSTPDMRWPSPDRAGSGYIPVVGPVEPIEPRRVAAPFPGARAAGPVTTGGPGTPRPNPPGGAARGPGGDEIKSGWQLAQRAWQEAGVSWEGAAAEAQQAGPRASERAACAPPGDQSLGYWSPDWSAPAESHATRSDQGHIPATGPDSVPARDLGPGPCPVQSPAARTFAGPPLSAPVSPVAPAVPPGTRPDELFRAWQGSVRKASAPRRRWSRRPGRLARRGRSRQAATIGAPAAVIVAVGAVALLMLTGRANEVLAELGRTGPQSPAAPGFTATVPSALSPGPRPAAWTGPPLPRWPPGAAAKSSQMITAARPANRDPGIR